MPGELSKNGVTQGDLVDYLTDIKNVVNELQDDHATTKTVVDELVETVNDLISGTGVNCVVYSEEAGSGCGLDVDDGNAEDIETNNDIVIRYNGALIRVAANADVDISADGITCDDDTITQAKAGAAYLFATTAGGLDLETVQAAGDKATAIDALAEYGHSSNIATYLAANEVVPIGCVQVTEGNSGTFTWGDDSISGETETFYSFEGVPRIITALSSFAAVADSTNFVYGTAVVRLGTGTRVALTGEATKSSEVGTAVATTKTGAWVVYALADDSVIAKQLGAAYASKAVADAAVRDMTPNPLLPIIGYFTVENASGSNFTMGTTKFDATGITATFNKVGPGANHVEIGRAALGQIHQVMQNAGPATLTYSTDLSLSSLTSD
jgi:hypothetical protein